MRRIARGFAGFLLLAFSGCDLIEPVRGSADAGTGQDHSDDDDDPGCNEEPSFLWPDAVASAPCEDDVDGCDLVGDSPRDYVDIASVWSRVEGDWFVIDLQLRGPMSQLGDPGWAAFTFAFDTNGTLDPVPTQTTDPVCRYVLAYWSPPSNADLGDGEPDGNLGEVVADEVVMWERDHDFYRLRSSVELECSTTFFSDTEMIEARFPLARVRGPSGDVRYAVVTHAGVDRLGEVSTAWDSGFGSCLWVTSRGGSPDFPLSLAPTEECTDASVTDGMCLTEG